MEIYVMEADGSNPRRLTDNEGFDGAPSWSPDGQYIAFQSLREGDSQQIHVTRLRPEGPEGPFFDPDPVEGWTGTIFSTPDDAQFDDYFVLSGNFRVHYGIESSNPTLAAQLEGLRDTGSIVHVWGQVTCPAIDFYGTQIQVTRIEVAMEAPAEEEGYEGWNTYMSERFGYALRYPGECTVMGSDLDKSVQFVGPIVNNEHWPWFFVEHYDSDFYHPPASTDVHQWIADSSQPYGEIGPEVEIAGLPTVHFIYEGGPGVYDSDHYFFIRGDQLFHILILHAGGQQDWELYNKFLQSFTFPSEAAAPSVEPASSVVDGWVGTLVKFPPGSQLDGYFERDDGQRFGIGAINDLRKQVEEYRWTGAQVQVWGQLLTGVPDMEGRQIQVERIEAISGPAMEARNLSPFAFPSASSVLPSDRWGTYHPWSAINGLLSSPWVEGAAGPGIGEWIMLTFPGTIEVHRIGVDVGYDRDEDDTFRRKEIFLANNRLKKATINFSSGDQIELTFSDTRGVQMMDISPVETAFVQIVIDEVYPGSRWDDTCLAEIEVWGRTK